MPNFDSPLPSISTAKKHARRLALRSPEPRPGHAKSLEMVAHRHGFRDWNTLSAVVRQRLADCPVIEGTRVTGHYMGQPVSATVLDAAPAPDRKFALTLSLDEPVDVVRFDSFSAMRQRLHIVVSANGETAERISDGTPHFVLSR